MSRHAAFDRDALEHGGYRYSTNARLSSVLANRRLSEATLSGGDLRGRTAIDIGCGDGIYTLELFDVGQPSLLCGVDMAEAAIAVARQRAAGRNLDFRCASAYELPFGGGTFDIAYLRGVLHHLDDPEAAVREAFRVAARVVIVEPNGYNPVLKIIEKTSTYHREHEEKSYPAGRIDRWIERTGATIVRRQWAGLVPMFCPDWLARATKAVEPFVERAPVLRSVACAVYVVVGQRDDHGPVSAA